MTPLRAPTAAGMIVNMSRTVAHDRAVAKRRRKASSDSSASFVSDASWPAAWAKAHSNLRSPCIVQLLAREASSYSSALLLLASVIGGIGIDLLAFNASAHSCACAVMKADGSKPNTSQGVAA